MVHSFSQTNNVKFISYIYRTYNTYCLPNLRGGLSPHLYSFNLFCLGAGKGVRWKAKACVVALRNHVLFFPRKSLESLVRKTSLATKKARLLKNQAVKNSENLLAFFSALSQQAKQATFAYQASKQPSTRRKHAEKYASLCGLEKSRSKLPCSAWKAIFCFS